MSRTEVEIEREYGPFPNEPRIHGVSFDGERVWFASGNKLQAFDPKSGKPTHALDIPSDAGVAFDGKHLYQLADGQIHKVDPKSGRILATIPAPSPERNSGLAWAEGSLWLGRGSDGTILELDPKTGKVLSTVVSDRFVTGVTFSEGELWHGTLPDDAPGNDRSELYHVDRTTSEVLERLALPEGVTCTGLEADGKGRFYCGGGKSGKIRVVRQPKRTASAR
jgi:streptogramin lyase